MGKIISILVRVVVFASLIVWLLQSDKLDLAKVSLLLQSQTLFLGIGACWACGVLFSSLRWVALVRGMDLPLTWGLSLKLTMTSGFFSLILPGAVGGDLYKAFFVYREREDRKTHALLSILLDRMIGLYGLFAVCAIALLANFFDGVQWTSFTVATLSIFGLANLGLLLILKGHFLDQPLKALWSYKLLAPFEHIYQGLTLFRERKGYLAGGILLSLIIQGVNMTMFVYLTRMLGNDGASFGLVASVAPIALLTTAVPIAPAGAGVGHLAFSELYAGVGLVNGADVFNLYLVGIVSLNLLGGLAYLSLPSRKSGGVEPLAGSAPIASPPGNH